MLRLFSVALLATLAVVPDKPAGAAGTLYDSLGGQPGVERIAHDAVVLYRTDPRLKDDFDNIDPDRIRTRLAEQICQLAGGPCIYHGRSMKEAHAGLETTEAKFNAVAEDMQIAMAQAGIPYWTQNRLMALLAPMHRDIVTR